MKKTLLIIVIVFTFGLFMMQDLIIREQVKSYYVILKVKIFNDHSSLATYLNQYDGEATGKVKYLNIGLWAKKNKDSFLRFLAEINKESCVKFVDTINIELQDIGEEPLPACTKKLEDK